MGRRVIRSAAAIAILLPALLLGVEAHPADPAAGREKASACQPCHGMDGLHLTPDAPSIAGQNEMYLREQLMNYRSGKRAHPVMSIIAADLGDEDIADLAAHYGRLKITVEVPE